jgi:hypothetical protein
MAIDGHTIQLTNLDRVLWPGFTKGDLISYYRRPVLPPRDEVALCFGSPLMERGRGGDPRPRAVRFSPPDVVGRVSAGHPFSDGDR